MSVPNAIYVECPDCKEETLHEVLKGRIGKAGDVLEGTVKCQDCGRVHVTVLREPKMRIVPVIVSDQGESMKMELELPEDEAIEVDDELFVEELPIIVSSIESKGARVGKAPVSEVDTIWAKRFDKVRVKISINEVQKTTPVEITALPEEEFFIGDLMTIGRNKVVIVQIKTSNGMARRGGVLARDIVRIYAKKARITYS